MIVQVTGNDSLKRQGCQATFLWRGIGAAFSEGLQVSLIEWMVFPRASFLEDPDPPPCQRLPEPKQKGNFQYLGVE